MRCGAEVWGVARRSTLRFWVLREEIPHDGGGLNIVAAHCDSRPYVMASLNRVERDPCAVGAAGINRGVQARRFLARGSARASVPRDPERDRIRHWRIITTRTNLKRRASAVIRNQPVSRPM